VLDAQRRLAEAGSQYFRSRTEYALSLKNVHFEKGTLLDYLGVVHAEVTSSPAMGLFPAPVMIGEPAGVNAVPGLGSDPLGPPAPKVAPTPFEMIKPGEAEMIENDQAKAVAPITRR